MTVSFNCRARARDEPAHALWRNSHAACDAVESAFIMNKAAEVPKCENVAQTVPAFSAMLLSITTKCATKTPPTSACFFLCNEINAECGYSAPSGLLTKLHKAHKILTLTSQNTAQKNKILTSRHATKPKL